MEKHRGEDGGQQKDIKDGDEGPDDNHIDDNDFDDEDKNDDDEDADYDDKDGEDDEDATDAKTTISCLYRLHDAASGCDILQTI